MNEVKVGIGVFIFKDGKFLFGQRKKSLGNGSWAVPGGHLEFSESFEDTARREVREEVGLEIENVRIGAITNDYFKEENKHYVTIWMLSDLKSGEPKIMEPDKYINLEWVDFNSMPEPLFLNYQQLFESEFIDGIKMQLEATKSKK